MSKGAFPRPKLLHFGTGVKSRFGYFRPLIDWFAKEMLAKLSPILSSFIDHWHASGGANASLQNLLTPAFESSATVTGRKLDGTWMLIRAGDRNHAMHGARLEGRLKDCLEPEAWTTALKQLSAVVDAGVPHLFEMLGTSGPCRNTFTRRVQAPIRPLEGYEAALISVWIWEHSLDPELERILAEKVHLYCGSEISSSFTEAPLSAKIDVINELSANQYGEVSPEDRIFLQLFEMGMYSETVLDGGDF